MRHEAVLVPVESMNHQGEKVKDKKKETVEKENCSLHTKYQEKKSHRFQVSSKNKGTK